jgi:hypothetical protein
VKIVLDAAAQGSLCPGERAEQSKLECLGGGERKKVFPDAVQVVIKHS